MYSHLYYQLHITPIQILHKLIIKPKVLSIRLMV